MDTRNIVLLAIVAILIIAPIVMFMGHGEEDGFFGGTDDAGGVHIAEEYNVYDSEGNYVPADEEDTEAQPDSAKQDYTLWFNSPWEPPSGEIESLLFCLQAAIGSIIIGYIFGYWHGGNKARKE